MKDDKGKEDCPGNIIEVIRNHDGSLKEISGLAVDVHLEQIGHNKWWLGIYKSGFRQVVWLQIIRDQMVVNSEMDDIPAPTDRERELFLTVKRLVLAAGNDPELIAHACKLVNVDFNEAGAVAVVPETDIA